MGFLQTLWGSGKSEPELRDLIDFNGRRTTLNRGVYVLLRYGFSTFKEVEKQSNENLLGIVGFGPESLMSVRRYMLEYRRR